MKQPKDYLLIFILMLIMCSLSFALGYKVQDIKAKSKEINQENKPVKIQETYLFNGKK